MTSNFPRLTLRDLFDADYYRANNPDIARFDDRRAFEHLENYGIQELRTFSPFFDIGFYLENNGDVRNVFAPLFSRELLAIDKGVALQGANLRLVVDHFLNNGVYEGRRFTPLPIDLEFYRANNPDLANFDRSQLLNHLIELGVNEGRKVSPEIDLNFYRSTYPDLARLSNIELLQHFNNFGRQEGRVAVPTIGQNLLLFDAEFYRASNQDLPANIRASDRELTQHFLNFGRNELRKFSPFFDARYYIDNNPDLRLAGIDTNQEALDHFQRFGLNEGRRFSQFFDVNYYLANNSDLRAAGFNRQQAFAHFIQNGLNEGRRPSLLFDPRYYIANNPDLLARQVSFRDAYREFQVGEPPTQPASGFQLARPASVAFDPQTIAPLIQAGSGTTAERLQNPTKWDDIPVGGTLSYSFVTTSSAFLYRIPGVDVRNVREVSEAVKINVRNIMRQYSEVMGINLVEVPDRPPNVGRMRILISDVPTDRQGIVFTFGPTDSPGDDRQGDIHLAPNVDFGAGPGSFEYESLLFGVGGALGLNEQVGLPGLGQQNARPVNEVLPIATKNNTSTVMIQDFPNDYNGAFARSPMSYDIRALQFLYGSSYYNATDTTYRYEAGNFINIKQTIWDAGGIDTLDFSRLPEQPPDVSPLAQTAPLPGSGYYFDMNEGGQLTAQNALNRSPYSYTVGTGGGTDGNPERRFGTTNTYGTTIAFGAEIENLTGSPGNDEILGNNLANNISGGSGDDQIAGARGADILTGNLGRDVFVIAEGDGGRAIADADIITDFTPGVDRIGLALGLRIDQIAFSAGSNPNDTILRLADTGEFLAVVRGVPQTAFPAGSFTFA